MKNNAVFYRGTSLLNGEQIIGVLTGLVLPSANSKTGPMVQAYILPANEPPTEAVKSGRDAAICGDCRHRSGSNIGRSCYVIWWLGPQNAWKGAYRLPAVEAAALVAGKHVRCGAFGDPSAIPAPVWKALLRRAAGWTGYTHFWRTCDPSYASFLMASVDSEDEKHEAQALGWRTFRVRGGDEDLHADEVICPASEEAGHSTTCLDCQLCRGGGREAKSVAILAHGQRMKWFSSPAHAEEAIA